MTVKLYTQAQVAKHNSDKSCWVIFDGKVYDVTDFIRDHPGGDDLILEYAGKDVSAIMRNGLEHAHSDAAYEILEDYCVGSLTTSASTENNDEQEEDYTNGDFHPRETDLALDAKKNLFLDLRKPLIPQMLGSNFTKEFYLEQVHKPRYLPYSAEFFGHPWLEPP